MSDQAAIESILFNLKRLDDHTENPLSDADRELVKQLTADVKYLGAFLNHASKNQVNDETARDFTRQIRDAVCEGEEVVGTFVVQTVSTKANNWFSKLYNKVPVKLDETARKVHEVRVEVERVYGDEAKLETADEGSEKLEAPSVRSKHVVGLDESTKDLIGYLKEQTQNPDIISIVGMAGIGKTALARKVFQHPSIQEEFPMRLWVSVSRFPARIVFLDVLTGFNVVMRDMHRMREIDLAMITKSHLDGKKFLIVFDDVRTPEDWSRLSHALPATNLGKVLITSRSADVAPDYGRTPYEMVPLSPEKGSELLQYEAFGEPARESEIERLGKLIAEKCNGSPLALTVVGGVVGKELSSWTKFSDHLVEDDEVDVMEKVVSMSYEALPSHLRECFLYFGMFPEGIEIPTWKLYRMWAAEGFLGKWTDSAGAEDTAEGYLIELINSNLVTVGKTSFDGRVKTCLVHELILDSCKKMAAKENFLQEVKALEGGNLEPPIDKDRENSYRRLCIHSNLPEFAAAKPMGRRVRSVVCTNVVDIVLPLEHISTISAGFKLLKVFDVKPIKFPKLPATLFDLLHVRFVHLSYDITSIPPAFSRLLSLETLIVEASQRSLEIRVELWKMDRLRHLKTNVAATILLPGAPTSSSMLVLRRDHEAIAKANEEAEQVPLADSSLQTLGVIASESCTEKILSTFGKLRQASVRGKLEKLLTGTSREGSFSNLAKLKKVERLKLQNDVPAENPEEGRLTRLPPASVFPPELRMLTLSDTFLAWSEVKVLASLERLEVLKLKKRAFVGKDWETNFEGGFRCLKHLLIGHTDLEDWKTAAGHFPALEHVELRHLDKLRGIPIELAKVQSLKVLTLNSCPHAVESAREVKKDKVEADKTVEFELTIVSST